MDEAIQTKTRGDRWLILMGSALLVVVLAVFGAVRLTMIMLGPPPLAAAERVSATVVDRDGNLLRAFTTPEGRWRLPVKVEEVDPRYISMLLAYEDRRFWDHWGIDPLAVARAVYQFVRNGHIVSGASTLTMQVARLLDGVHVRTLAGKWRQAVRALQLEQELSKEEILELYLLLAPFGGNLEGVRAASLAYFGKEPRRLSIAEAALLVALPQSPEWRRPDRRPDAARWARDRVLSRMVEEGIITEAEFERARKEPVPRTRRDFPRFAPHASETEVLERPHRNLHRLTLSRELQAQLETLAREHARALGRRISAAVLVVDNHTGEILAHVGSSDYLDEGRFGAIDMTGAIRSPGSTLKPIIYGLAFEAGLAHPETLIEDRPTRFGQYAPKNFDEDFRGSVTIREALAHSLNIPAVKVLNAVGPARLIARIRSVGVEPVLPSHEQPSLAVALGGVGLSLRDLATLFVAIARGGEAIELRHRYDDGVVGPPKPQASPRRLMSAVAAWYVADILKSAPPPTASLGGAIAYKTGTSYGYKDAWAVGFDGAHTVAVWVGRADGTSTPELTGRLAAAPLLFEAFQRIGTQRVPLASPPPGVLQVSGGALPPPLRRFAEPGEGTSVIGAYLEPPVQIAFPPDRAELDLGDADGLLLLKADGGVLPLTWMVDGQPIPSDSHRREVVWQPEGRGFVKLTVTDAKGRVDRVSIRLR